MSGQSDNGGSGGGGFRSHRDTAQVDMPMAPPRRPGAGVAPAAPSVPVPALTGPVPLPADGRSDASPLVRTVERHLDEILAAVPQPDAIELAVLDAQGLLCAEDVVSQRALPAFDQAALDGYAARADDVAAATVAQPVELAVVGESVAGASAPSSIGPGLALKVAAGAMLPSGADVVVPGVWTDQGTVRVAVQAGPPAGSYVRRTGDDVAPGDPAVHVGTPIGPAQISLLAAVGRDRVLVRPRPRVVVLSAGTELVDVSATPSPGQVVDVNSYALAAAARDAGADAYRWGILPGDPRRLTEVLESQLLRSDLLLISGTFASGGFDMVQEALAGLGGMRFRQVAMHPGPAQGFGRLGRDEVPVICVPGEPVAALVAFEVFVRPAIRLMLGKRQLFRRTVQAIAGQPLLSPLGYRQYLHGTVMRHPDGGYVVEPVGEATDALLARMARANCLIVIDEDVTEVAAGGLITVMPLLLGG
ncbi:gephyrin-like molybdotransferase Glp [Blastococcus saxobsidens]|uniref:Molybdopterin molybdenumtransferase n=1 Tax=Blastococcus saxobsidens (strain DD2) TaxID=1146883 RepID=H6RRQ0_BLASD|nr:gephyrin-like molybdotransferase Glp [Blastococcus saxobsidens]CCG01693.1 Molybdopterin biosynthesis protein moeA 1 [Blastococcus saxobsidens DD2]